MMDRRISGLYALTEDISDTALLLEQVSAAVRGGARVVQYRNKSGSSTLQSEQAAQLAGLVRAAGATFIVNDSIELAARSGADGVHLGREDGEVGAARDRLGSAALIGVSCYDDLDRALAAEQAGADYVAFGSFFPSITKPAAVRAPIELLRQAEAVLRIPIVAIGGINASNCAPLRCAGADAMAVASALFRADDIEAAARALLAQFDTGRQSIPRGQQYELTK